MALPSREEWPDYYSGIASPICIDDIYRKTQAHAYPAVQDAVQDWELLARNAEQVWAGWRAGGTERVLSLNLHRQTEVPTSADIVDTRTPHTYIHTCWCERGGARKASLLRCSALWPHVCVDRVRPVRHENQDARTRAWRCACGQCARTHR